MKHLLMALALGLVLSQAAWASTGLSLSIENLFAPLGKQVEQIKTDGTSQTGFGRETSEFIGIEGFTELNQNWRVLYGAQTALIGSPLFKLTGGVAFMINTPYPIPLRPYILLAANPILATAGTGLPPWGFSLHTGLGLDYSWNNQIYAQVLLRIYLMNPYPLTTEEKVQTNWNPGSFSLSAGMGYLF